MRNIFFALFMLFADAHLPDLVLTPGDVLSVTKEQVCVRGYSKNVRNVPESEKRQVYAEYGIKSHLPGEYEVDHLISLELGGSNDIKNLWPEHYSEPLGAHTKDKLEDHLHYLVCHGQMSLKDAQDCISINWIVCYMRVMGEVPND